MDSPTNGTPLAGYDTNEGQNGVSSSDDNYAVTFAPATWSAYIDPQLLNRLFWLEATFHITGKCPILARRLTNAWRYFSQLGTSEHSKARFRCWRFINSAIARLDQLERVEEAEHERRF